MKKTYIHPQINVNHIETESFLCQSGDIENSFLDQVICNENQILSKEHQYDIWDLDDEE